MTSIRIIFFFVILCFYQSFLSADLYVGIGKTDIIPPPGNPSAGYRARQGAGMLGTHDPLLATALFIDNGEKQIVLCSVDHLGLPYTIAQKITQLVKTEVNLKNCEIYIGSSHTHAGGGAYLDIPVIGESLAGKYNPELVEFYTHQIVEAIHQSYQNRLLAKIGIGYTKADVLSQYRSQWPQNIFPLQEIAIIKITKLDNTPLAVLFNYPLHPTVLDHQNRYFSADFVGYARTHLQKLLTPEVAVLYFNGAQGDIAPLETEKGFEGCDRIGQSLANTIHSVWNQIPINAELKIDTYKDAYHFTPQANPFGLTLPLNQYESEMNVIVLNQRHAFVTIPGELSCVYDKQLKEIGQNLGYQQVSILGLVNDAHGYIISPESWEHQTFESRLSFGGKQYGEQIKNRALSLLNKFSPNQ